MLFLSQSSFLFYWKYRLHTKIINGFVAKAYSHILDIIYSPFKIVGSFDFPNIWVEDWAVKKSFAPLVVDFGSVMVFDVVLVNCLQDVMLSLVDVAANRYIYL